MASRTTVPAAPRRLSRALTAVGLTALVAACGADGPGVRDVGMDTGDREEQATVVVGEPAPRAWIDEAALNSDAPQSYTVVKGDTLWDISDRFLKEPWRWQEIWSYNPQIADPNLIYPGDQLALEYADGKATLVLTRDGKVVPPSAPSPGTVRPPLGKARVDEVTRLSPRIRSEPLERAVPMIPGDAIRQFLVQPRVVQLDAIENAPYVIGNDDGHLMSAAGQQIYARGEVTRDTTRYGIYRKSTPLVNPIDGRTLGYEITHVADARLMNIGDPSTLAITSNKMETNTGDILLPARSYERASRYVTRVPALDTDDGRIISLVNAISQTGRDQVVVLNVGTASGIATGDVLAIEADGGSLIDTHARGGRERVMLPDIRTGVVMVFETFEEVSYALVMESTRPVMLNDVITGI